jgi:hypothetical protein
MSRIQNNNFMRLQIKKIEILRLGFNMDKFFRNIFLVSLALYLSLVGTNSFSDELDPSNPSMNDSMQAKLFYWPSGIFIWSYSNFNEPEWLKDGEGLALYKQAAEAWKDCGLNIQFNGLTTSPAKRNDHINSMGWAKLPPNYRAITLRKPISDSLQLSEADVVTNISNKDIEGNYLLLSKVIMHEFGHALGLIHSERCDDVMSSAKECGIRIANPPPQRPTQHDLDQCAIRYKK